MTGPIARRKGTLRLLLALVLVVAGVAMRWLGGGSEGAAAGTDLALADAAVPTAPSGSLRAASPQITPAAARMPAPAAANVTGSGEEDEREREAAKRVWEKRLERARHTLDAYIEATRYPPHSRPISEHPDQVHPAEPERDLPLDAEGAVRILLRQDRVFLTGDETVHFFVRCQTREGAPAPCEVLKAGAREAEHRPGALALSEIPLTFSPDGSSTGEGQAGGFVASLTPSRDGFALYEGTLRVHLEVRSGELTRRALFDVLYTPSSPARFTGTVRETIDDGSLNLHVGLEVRRPGRYVITGRVDDAEGRPFALLTFNEELAPGRREAALTVFGKLLVDERPALPLVLRDVEGFLLRESGDPDRELLQSLRGQVHRTQTYPLARFSAEEWQSEERERYVNELSRDVERAEKALGQLDGAR